MDYAYTAFGLGLLAGCLMLKLWVANGLGHDHAVNTNARVAYCVDCGPGE
jgi:hypothetical protein